MPHIRAVDFGDPDPVRTPGAVIRVEKIAGPALTASGGVDALWPSYDHSAAVHQRLAAQRFRYAHPDLRFENAGHGLGATVPYLPSPTVRDFGGSVGADETAKAVLWPRIVRFMAGLPAD